MTLDGFVLMVVQCRVLELLVERVVYDGPRGQVSVTFRPAGIKALTEQMTNQREETP